MNNNAQVTWGPHTSLRTNKQRWLEAALVFDPPVKGWQFFFKKYPLHQNIVARQHFNSHFGLCCMIFIHIEMWKSLKRFIQRRVVTIWTYIILIWTGAVIKSANLYITITHPLVYFGPECSFLLYLCRAYKRQPVRNMFHTKPLFFFDLTDIQYIQSAWQSEGAEKVCLYWTIQMLMYQKDSSQWQYIHPSRHILLACGSL